MSGYTVNRMANQAGSDHMRVRAIILHEIKRIAIEHKKLLAPMDDAAQLLSMGLDSLCLAVLVVRLEETLGVDPFSSDTEVEFPYTLGDLIRTYEIAATAT
jgi:acyl carrier protein